MFTNAEVQIPPFAISIGSLILVILEALKSAEPPTIAGTIEAACCSTMLAKLRVAPDLSPMTQSSD